MSYLDLKSQDRYVRWVNRILARALKPYKLVSLKDESIRNGRALYDVVEHLSGAVVPGYLQIESRRAVLHNLQVLLNHVAGLKIRMSLIQPADIERGDLLAVLRFLLGLVRHYEPHRIRYRHQHQHISMETGPLSLCSSQSSQHQHQCQCQSLQKRTRPAAAAAAASLADHRDAISTDLLPSKYSPRRARNVANRQSCSEGCSNNVHVSDSRVRRLSDSSTSGTHSLPRDILEIHMKLKELKQLLSRPDIVTDAVEKRDKSCQTSGKLFEETQERVLQQRESTIAHQKDQLTRLRELLDRRIHLTECLTKELSVMKASSQQSRRGCIDPNEAQTLERFISLLKSIRSDRGLRANDLDRFDEGLNLLSALSGSSRPQAGEKSNVAVVNPCSNNRNGSSSITDGAVTLRDESRPTPVLRNTVAQFAGLRDPDKRRENPNTNMMVYLQGTSAIPFQSVIPLPLSRITLLDVKQSTKSLLSSDGKFRYFFNTISPDFGPTRQEILGDEDKVPGIDGKIVVHIQR